MKKVNLQIIFTFILGLLVHTVGNSQGTPSFTGNAATDFITTAGYIHFNDFVYDVGLPPAAPAGTVTGWDMQTAFFYYDQERDDLYVGVDFAGIFGGFILTFDNGNDGTNDVYIGVSRMDDVTEFGIYVYTSDQDEAPEVFPVAATGSAVLHSYNHNSTNPDLEFKIEDISNYVDDLCGVNFNIFAGSYEDGPIGEDHMQGKLELCPLPIELVSMFTDGKGRRIAVEWTTATENNNDYFEVQHATDANSEFKTVGTVQGSGTTTSPTSYIFYHDSPVRGNNYYRLKQVDLSGSEWHSWVVTEQYQGADGSVIDVYPNPNSGQFMLGLPTVPTNTDALVRVIDSRGATALEENIMLNQGLTAYAIETQNLPKGIYHVSLTMMNSQNTYNKTFMIR